MARWPRVGEDAPRRPCLRIHQRKGQGSMQPLASVKWSRLSRSGKDREGAGEQQSGIT
jgi:hypothetical protein